MNFVAVYPSPLGALTLAETDGVLTALVLEGQRYAQRHLPPQALERETKTLREAERWLDQYFTGQRPDPQILPLAPRGTPFQQRVWRELLTIPYGVTVSYGELARRVGSSPRAVGWAVGRNPISIVIPCHRVLGKNGSLTGYAGGPERKRWLLRHEGIDC